MTIEQFSNYLDSGAILRHEGQWHLYLGKNVASQYFSKTHAFNEVTHTLVHAPFFFETNPSFCLQSIETHPLKTQHFILSDEALCSLCDRLNSSPPDRSQITWTTASKESFSKSFRIIQDKIKEGSLKKAVPIVFETTNWVPKAEERAILIRRLIDTPSHLNVYGFWDHDSGLIGASPEILFEYGSKYLKTMALAGTRSKANHQISLLLDSKELKEHQLVVSDLEHQLSSWGSLTVQNTFELELPSLFHLYTPLLLKLNEQKSILEIIQKLHPTPALGVFPRDFNFKWMQNLPEQSLRRFFGSPISFRVSSDSWVCVVGIRCLDWTREGSRVGAGCGIIAESKLEREWDELYRKRDSVKSLLQI